MEDNMSLSTDDQKNIRLITSDSEETKTIVKLITSDDEQFGVDKNIAEMSETIKNLLSDMEGSEIIPLPNVTGKIMGLVLDYCKWHHDHPQPVPEEKVQEKNSNNICEWDLAFMNVEQKDIFNLILAANYLDIKSLLDLGCKTIANMVKGKTPEEIKKIFGVERDFTKEEIDQMYRENPWLAEGENENDLKL